MQAALMNLQTKPKAQQEKVSKRLLQETNQEKEVGARKRKQRRTDMMQDRHGAAVSSLLCLGREC